MTRVHDTWADSDTPLTLELYYSGSWHDITADLSDDGWTITRGRSATSKTADPSEFTCTLDNTGGKYSPRNPSSVLYGLVGRNTPIRAKVTVGGTTYTRFVGEVSEWPQRWTTKGTSYAPITASGITRRLMQGLSSEKSAYTRGVTSPVAPMAGVVAYWPMEDEAGSTSFASGLPGGPSMNINGHPTLASDSSFYCSRALPVASADFNAGGVVPAYAAGTSWQVTALIKFPAAGSIADKTRLFQVRTSSTTCTKWDLLYCTGGALQLNVTSDDGTAILTGTQVGLAVDGSALRVRLYGLTNGSGTDWSISVLEPGSTVGTGGGGTIATSTPGNPGWIAIAPDSALTGTVIGQMVVQSPYTSIWDHADILDANHTDSALDRVTRVAAEEGIALTSTGVAAQSTSLGYQLPMNPIDLIREAEAADQGWFYEPRDAAGIAYRTRDSSCGQAPKLTITYTDNLLLPFEPNEDDQLTRNRLTLTRIGGGSYIYERTTGTMSTAAPPAGVGIYDEALSISVYSDAYLANQASWRVHEGTVDEARWPVIGIELAHPVFRASATLTAAALGVDIGDRVVVTNLPAWLPPFNVDQLVQGYTEQVTPTRYAITLACTPYSPRRVPLYNDAGADPDDVRYSGEGTALTSNITSTATSVAITAPAGVTWTHADGNYTVLCGGEVVTVTAVSGSAPNYTLTVTRSGNGVVKAHTAGDAIDVAAPGYYAL